MTLSTEIPESGHCWRKATKFPSLQIGNSFLSSCCEPKTKIKIFKRNSRCEGEEVKNVGKKKEKKKNMKLRLKSKVNK